MIKKISSLSHFSIFIIGLSILAYGYILHRVLTFEQGDIVLQAFQFSSTKISLLFIIMLLWLVNHLTEMVKWQSLMHPFSSLTLKESFLQVMAGNLLAMGSPGRLAEPGGRLALLPHLLRAKGLVMTFLGGFVQTGVITICGLIALFYWTNGSLSSSFRPVYLGLTIGTGILGGVMAFIYYYRHSSALKQFYQHLSYVKYLSWFNLGGVILLSILRYGVFTSQLYVWLVFFDVPIPPLQFVGLSSLYFFFITVIPSFFLTDIGVRGAVSLFVFQAFVFYPPLFLAAIFCLWFTNQVIPALIGSLVLIYHK